MLTRKEITTGKVGNSILKFVRVGIPQRKKVVEKLPPQKTPPVKMLYVAKLLCHIATAKDNSEQVNA